MTKHANPTRQDLQMLYERLQETLPLMERLLQTGQARGPAAPLEAARPPAGSSAPAASRFHVERYGERHYALYEGDELLAVTVYRRGAETVKQRLDAQDREMARLRQRVTETGRTSAVGRLQAERSDAARRQR